MYPVINRKTTRLSFVDSRKKKEYKAKQKQSVFLLHIGPFISKIYFFIGFTLANKNCH